MTTTEAPPLGHVDVVSSTCWYLFIFDFFIWFSILFINILWRGGPSSFRCSRRCSPSGRQRPVVCREMNGFQSATRPAPDPRQTRARPAPDPHPTSHTRPSFVLFFSYFGHRCNQRAGNLEISHRFLIFIFILRLIGILRPFLSLHFVSVTSQRKGSPRRPVPFSAGRKTTTTTRICIFAARGPAIIKVNNKVASSIMTDVTQENEEKEEKRWRIKKEKERITSTTAICCGATVFFVSLGKIIAAFCRWWRRGGTTRRNVS